MGRSVKGGGNRCGGGGRKEGVGHRVGSGVAVLGQILGCGDQGIGHQVHGCVQFWAQNHKQFLVICAAGYWSSVNTIGILFQKYVYSSFSLKMVLNCIHIWFVDLLVVKD